MRTIVPWVVAALLVVAGAGIALRGFEDWEHPPQVFDPEHDPEALVTLAPGQTDTVRFAGKALAKMGYRVATVEAAPPPPPLRMQGHIEVDANTLLRIRPRFPGELVEIGQFDDPSSPGAAPRTLRYGDHVHKGQLLALIWSKEVGEKKSELIDALSKLETTRDILERLEKAEKGAIAQRTIIDARREYAAARVAVANARRTLLSWRLSEDEIQAVYQEAERLQSLKPKEGARESDDLKSDIAVEKSWANTELRAPIEGTILEKNFNVGDLVDPDDDLYKIADTSRIRVFAQAYEEDLPTLRNLPTDKRHWKIDLKSDPFDEPIPGTFEIVGGIIDPAQHTATVMGTLDNATGRMNLGQFITATIDLDADPGIVAVPAKAVIEDGSLAAVFVEDEAHPNDFSRRLVAITSRIPGKVCIRSEPNEAERAAGAAPLTVGERVLASGVLELNAELAVLKAAQPQVQARVHIP